MSSSSTLLSSILFLLLLFSLLMDEAFGARTEIRKLKETVKMRRNMEGEDQRRSSKMWLGPSTTRRCGIGKAFKNMETSDHDHGQFRPLPGGYSSSLCQACLSPSHNCYTIRCVITKVCRTDVSPMTCTTSERCERIP